MKWLKKWYYLIFFFGVGAAYLTCVDDWQVYAKPVAAVQDWCESLKADADTDVQNKNYSGESEDVQNNLLPENTAPPAATASPVPAEGDEPLQSEKTPIADNSPAPEGQKEEGMPEGGTGTDEPQAPLDREIVYKTVEDDYFADAVFIGDSRTVGMDDYGELDGIATFYASKGMTVYKMFTEEIVSVPGQKNKITVEEALQNNTFAKIYLMIGINEMGTGTVDTFMKKYEEVVTHLRELQPDAVIYLQGIMKVTKERSEKAQFNITNEGIDERNERIAQLADNEKIFYLDVNPLVCDETGGMIEDYTYDGAHLKGKHIAIWKQFLKEHVVDFQDSDEAGMGSVQRFSKAVRDTA